MSFHFRRRSAETRRKAAPGKGLIPFLLIVGMIGNRALAAESRPPVAAPKIAEDAPAAASAPVPASPGVIFYGSERLHPKDPTAAACFSLLMPGLGHVYSESYTRGLIVAPAFGGGLAAILNNGRKKLDPTDPSEKVFLDPEGLNVAIAVTGAVYLLAAHDARAQARRYNRRLGFRFAVTARGPGAELRF